MTQEQEIQELIKKHLPQQVGETLKVTLEHAEKDAKKVKEQDEKLIERRKEIDKLESIIQEYKKFDERNSLLDAREKELEAKENKLEIDELKYQLSAEKDKTEFSKNIALGIVRNTEYRKTIFDSENQEPYQDYTGNWHYPQPKSKVFTETETKE